MDEYQDNLKNSPNVMHHTNRKQAVPNNFIQSQKPQSCFLTELIDDNSWNAKIDDVFTVNENLRDTIDIDIDHQCFGVYQLAVHAEKHCTFDFFDQDCHILFIEKTAAAEYLSNYFAHSESMLYNPDFPSDAFTLRIDLMSRELCLPLLNLVHLVSEDKDRVKTLSLRLRNVDYFVGVSGSESEVGLAVNQLRELVQNVVSLGKEPNYFARNKIVVSLDANQLIKRVVEEVPSFVLPLIESGKVLTCSPGKINEYFWGCVKQMQQHHSS